MAQLPQVTLDIRKAVHDGGRSATTSLREVARPTVPPEASGPNDDGEVDVLVVSPPWPRSVLLVCSSVILCALLACVFGKVEQTGAARGVFRFAGGSHTLSTQATGVIAEVRVHSGDVITEGQVLMTLDSAASSVALLEANRGVARAEDLLDQFERRRRPIYEKRRALLQQRVRILGGRAASHRSSNQRLRSKAQTYDNLAKEGLASGIDKLNAHDEVAVGERAQLGVQDDIAQTQVSIATLDQEFEAESTRLANELAQARDHRDAVALGVAQNAIIAPRAGRVESILVKPGDTVTAATPVVRVIPRDAPQQIIAFVPEHDRGFITASMEAHAELDQFPPSEFGWVAMRVTHVGNDLASKAEMKDAFGDANEAYQGPLHRVELEIVPSSDSAKLREAAVPGAMVTVRYVLRRQRVIFLLIEPLRRFFE